MTTHKAIREALEAGPTEGPWVADDNEGFSPWSIWSRMSPTGHGEAGPKIAQIQLANDEADATFIAACNPAAIRALLADLDAKTAEVERETTARQEAQRQLYEARERHTAEVKKLQAEIGRLQALRPVAMTRDELKVLMNESGYGHVTAQEKADFINGFRHAESHHHITQKEHG